MYTITAEAAFDSAHFLSGYGGKCRNLHGHRWRVVLTLKARELGADGMLMDFTDLKRELRAETERFDHALIYRKNSLKSGTVTALNAEGFRLAEVAFQTTAENFAKYFYDIFAAKGFSVASAEVFETPENSARYDE